MKRKICVVTGTRAEYGLLRWVMQGIADDPWLDLQIVATGMHLSAEYGETWRDIENDGFAITKKVDIRLRSDTATGISHSMGMGIAGFAEALDELRPDIVIVLGDRFEIFAAVAAALVARVPVAHLHGGELTEGAIDDAFRHAITKMSHLHFTANAEYRRRVIQLGERPDRVFDVGGLGVDVVAHTQLMDRSTLEASLGFELGEKNLLVTFHPATLDQDDAGAQMDELLGALDTLPDTRIIITMPNADSGGRAIGSRIEQFVQTHKNAAAFISLGQVRYLSCLRLVDGVVGNSSSGLLEAPSFRIGTVNIGDRQRGRFRASSVIDCEPERQSIVEAIAMLYSSGFRQRLASSRNPYGEPGASKKIVDCVRSYPLEGLTVKRFHDVDFSIQG